MIGSATILDPRYDGLPAVQLARRLGVSVEAVRTARTRERQRLRRDENGEGRGNYTNYTLPRSIVLEDGLAQPVGHYTRTGAGFFSYRVR